MRVLELVIDGAARGREGDFSLALFVVALFESTSDLPVSTLRRLVSAGLFIQRGGNDSLNGTRRRHR
jgi:hypothetical protein